MQEQDQFLAFLQRPSRLAELQAGQEIFEAAEVRSFLPTIHDIDGMLRELTPLLASSDGFHASALALICGSLVERGGDEGIVVEAILELMWRQLQLAHEYLVQAEKQTDEAIFQLLPEATRAHYGLPFTLLAAMTTLSRDKEARKRWRKRQDVLELINELAETYDTLFYLQELWSLLDDEEFLVLDPINKRGFQVRLEGVRDRMYHCYALLQHEILARNAPGYLGANPTDPQAVRYAQNRDLTAEDYQQAGDLSDEQRFSFCYPAALRLKEGHYTLDPLAFFPGSASFFEIPTLDGTPILLIGERTMRFTWSPANMYSVLHGSLVSHARIVRELEVAEVEDWLQRILARTQKTSLDQQ